MKSLEADVEDVNTALVCHSESVDGHTAEMQSYKNLFQDISIIFKAFSNFLIKLSISMSTDSEVSLFGRSMQRSISALLRGPVLVVPGKKPFQRHQAAMCRESASEDLEADVATLQTLCTSHSTGSCASNRKNLRCTKSYIFFLPSLDCLVIF